MNFPDGTRVRIPDSMMDESPPDSYASGAHARHALDQAGRTMMVGCADCADALLAMHAHLIERSIGTNSFPQWWTLGTDGV